jgi:hypothetical protein
MLGTAAALAMSCAKADTIDPAVYSIQFDGVPGALNSSGPMPQASSYSFSSGTLDLKASGATTSQPAATASVKFSGGCTSGCGDGIYDATAEIDYYIEVSGPPGVTVPYYFVITAGLTFTDGNGGGDGEVTLTAPSDPGLAGFDAQYYNDFAFCGPNGCYGVDYLGLLSDTQYMVQVVASANAVQTSSGNVTAWVEHYIYIDPSFLGGDQFSLIISSGISNSPIALVARVPEPSTWAMMLLGFAGYRASRKAAATAI